MTAPLKVAVVAEPGMSLLLGSSVFWENLQRDICEARDYVYVQTLSFEGDGAGQGLANAMIASPAKTKRVVADSFSKFCINDRWLVLPGARRDQDLQREVCATRAMVDRMNRNGVPVRYSWPIVGRGYHRLLARNHKKLIVIDDRIAYMGGINFSDHNFSWHDFMVRIDNPTVAAYLRDDFEHTWEGRDQDVSTVIDGDELVIGDGRGNQGMRNAVARVINEARKRIVLQCPYVGAPFWELLGDASRRGVEVTVIMPENNNRPILKWDALNAAGLHGFEFRLLPGAMTHMKAMLVDDAAILGSANFDFLSFRHQPEIVYITRSPDLVREVTDQILTPDLARSTRVDPDVEGFWKQRLAGVGMAIAERLISLGRERRASPIAPGAVTKRFTGRVSSL